MVIFDHTEKELKFVREINEGQLRPLARNMIREFAQKNVKQITTVSRRPNKHGEYKINIFDVNPNNPGCMYVAEMLLTGQVRLADEKEAIDNLNKIKAERQAAIQSQVFATQQAAQATLASVISSVKSGIDANPQFEEVLAEAENTGKKKK